MAESHIITWFSPFRPVENGTVHVRPEPEPKPAETEDDD